MRLGRLPIRHRYKGRSSRPFLTALDRFRHLWVIGKTGTGKSTAQEHWILQDIKSGVGVAVFDPHGAMIDELLTKIPKWRYKDVILFDPSDWRHPIGFNVFEKVPQSRRPYVASSIVDMFEVLWQLAQAPQLKYILYNACAALLDYPNGTMLGIKYLLISPTYRKRVIGQIQDEVIKAYWTVEFEKLLKGSKGNDPTQSNLNKIGQLIADPTIRHIIGQSRSRFSFSDILDNGKIFLARLPQGELGFDKSSLIGGLLLTSFHSAVLTRKTTKPFYLYVDEFHTFGRGFNEMLSGIRKYNVGMILAHQYIAQLDDSLREALIGTVGTIVMFQVGASDAETLSPTFSRRVEDLTSTPPYSAYVRHDAKTYYITIESPQRRRYSRQKLINKTRNDYSRPVAKVRDDLQRFVHNLTESDLQRANNKHA